VLRSLLFFLATLVVAEGVDCSSHAPAAENASGGGPFRAVAPSVYVAKVKNVLVGLAPTDDEVKAVEADPRALGGLVDGWMGRPEYAKKMRRFFQLAFQQTQISANDFADQVYGQLGRNPSSTPLMLENIEESFARTMVELTQDDRPFTEAMTTRTFMMTTALKELYAFLDVWEIDNLGNVFDHFREKNRRTSILVGASHGPIPIEQTLDPASPNFMHWYNPDVATEEIFPQCQQDPVQLRPSAIAIHYLLLGTMDGRRLATGAWCPGFDGTARAPQFAASDFADWTMVTLRAPAPGEPTTTFYDLPKLRAARELVLSMPRAGFFSTPAFFANWQTNASNQMRVTANQALIVATGATIDEDDRTEAPGTPGLDSVHAGQPQCSSCHSTLDPTRSVLAATWSWNYHEQLDAKFAGEPGLFAFRGIVRPVKSIADFADVLAKHPLVAPAWTQKLCHYVNSAPCDESDPEFSRIVDLFRSSGFSWRALVKALVTSPLTTLASPTQTRLTNGEVVAVERRDHFCAALDARLGFTDACGLGATTKEAAGPTVPAIVSGLPSDGYGRGAITPILPNQPTLFFVAGVQNICESIAREVVDADPRTVPTRVKHWSSGEPDAAIRDFVSIVMALAPSDARSATARSLLTSHFNSALARPGTTPTDALRSTFVAACMAPSAMSVGL
jgi:hypothetical protein